MQLRDLKPDPQNRRKHTPRNLGMLADALREVGASRSIVIDETGEILAGNGVVAAASTVGLSKVAVVEADGDTIVAVRRRGLTAEQKRALALYDNRVAELAEWDWDQLGADQAAGLTLEPWFTDEELAAGFSQAPKAGYTDPDAVPQVRATEIQRGDMFELGRHRLLCGDSMVATELARLMDATPAMVFTDPPYGMDLDTDFSSMVRIARGKKYQRVVGDEKRYNPSHIFAAFPQCPEIILWGADYYAELLPNRNDGSWFVWDKANGGDAPNDDYDKMFGSNFELAWSRTKHKRALVRVLWKGIFGLAREDTKRRVHPTQKPTALVGWFLERFTASGASIADLFLGSGSTLIAAEQLGRACRAIELEPPYCQIAIDRWEAFTGQRAQKVGEAIRA